MRRIRLRSVAYARSGDKGGIANIGVATRSRALYQRLCEVLTKERVAAYFGQESVERYELPNLYALNFLLPDALEGGASCSLRVDSQGKSFAQMILNMKVEIPEELL